MFTIINKTTKKPLRLSYDMETHGAAYMTYERPAFSVEDENKYNQNCVIFMSPTKEACDAILLGDTKNKGEITQPELTQGWIDGEKSEYEIKEVA